MWQQLCLAALLTTALSAAHDQREERQTRDAGGFWLGGRYGRSLHTVMSTRNDRIVRRMEEETGEQANNRFFMGSRYGKRASPSLSDFDRWKREICDCTPRNSFKRNAMRDSV